MTSLQQASGGSTALPRGRLAENVLHFVRVLRHTGMPVGPAKVIDALSAVQVELLGRLRAPDVSPADEAALRNVIGVTINGIAAGLRNTG